MKGQLVEPIKQIVYYIDPGTPKKWVPYLIAGVNDWNKAFEAAGFKNAIVAKEWPNDSRMSLEDATSIMCCAIYLQKLRMLMDHVSLTHEAEKLSKRIFVGITM